MTASLRSNGIDQIAALSGWPAINLGTSYHVWEYFGKLNATPTGLVGILGTSSATTSSGFATNASLQLRMYSAGTNRGGTSSNFFLVDGNEHHYRYIHQTDGTWAAYRDDMVTPWETGTLSASNVTAVLNQAFRSSSTASMFFSADTAWMRLATSSFDQTLRASLSGGTGNTWPTDSGNNQGTLSIPPWPSDDSQWVGFGATYTLNADGASWQYSGGQASLLFGRLLSADGASWSYSGGVAPLLYGRQISADGAAWSYAGGTATLTYTTDGATYTLNADGASWSYSGESSSLLLNRVIYADGQSYQYSSGAASLLFNRVIQAAGGSWSYSLANAVTLFNRSISANGLQYAYSGGSALLEYSGAVNVSINGYTVAYGLSPFSGSYNQEFVRAVYSESPVSATYSEI